MIKFVEYRKWAFFLSAVLILTGIASLSFKGLNLGIDFTGGTIFHLQIEEEFTLDEVREVLAPFDLDGSIIQRTGDIVNERGREVIIKTPSLSDLERARIIEAFKERWPVIGEDQILRVESVGPAIGRELTREAFWAVGIAMLAMVLYITLRFEFKFAVSSIAALFHDIFIIIAIFSLFQIEINSPFIAAILTTVGYSINDTIIIIDRIRENLKYHRKESYAEIVNKSITQNLSRTINTSLTTFFVLFSLFVAFNYFIGGIDLKNFALALLLGLIFGTYSSIFVASPLWYTWKKWELNKKAARST